MNERLSNLIKHPLTVPVAVGVISFSSGVGLGYFLARRPKKAELHALPDSVFVGPHADELMAIRDDLDEMNKPKTTVEPIVVSRVEDEEGNEIVEETVEYFETDIEVEVDDEDPEVVTALAEKIKEAMTGGGRDEPEIEVPTVHNVFSANDDDWDYEKEVAERGQGKPYVLHKDEFWAEEMNFTQSTLTYYAGDDIMCDEDDTPVYNYRNVIGELKFGHGSGDPNVFYVRNEGRRSEYEILFDSGLYSKEVLGLDIEDNERVKGLQHSKQKFRME